jgi:hypothetical protein
MTRRPVRRALGLLAVLAASLAGTACLQADGKAVLEKNGSGTLTRSIAVDLKAMEEVAAMMKQFLPGAPAGEGAEEDAETWIDPAKVTETLKARAAKVPGVEIKTLETVEDAKAGRLRIRIEVAFTDLESLGKSGLLVNESVEVRKNADGAFTLEMDPLAGMAKEFAAREGPAANPMLENFLPLVEPLLETLELKTTIVLPGAVVETNGKKSEDGKSVSWAATWSDVKAGKCVRTVTFKGEGVDVKPVRYRPDVFALMKLFEPVPKPKKPAPGVAAGEKKPEAPGADGPAEKPPEKPADKPAEKPAEQPPTPAK